MVLVIGEDISISDVQVVVFLYDPPSCQKLTINGQSILK